MRLVLLQLGANAGSNLPRLAPVVVSKSSIQQIGSLVLPLWLRLLEQSATAMLRSSGDQTAYEAVRSSAGRSGLPGVGALGRYPGRPLVRSSSREVPLAPTSLMMLINARLTLMSVVCSGLSDSSITTTRSPCDDQTGLNGVVVPR